MALITCSECKQQISDQARTCPKCGCPNQPSQQGQAVNLQSFGVFFGWEYKSKLTLLGVPLIHIAQGMNPETRAPRVAKGIIAIGNIAIGLVAIGGLSVGGVSLGGLSLGVLALGGVSLGGFVMGGLAAGYLAIGGLAIGKYALGGAAFGMHSFSSLSQDPEVFRFLEELFGMKKGSISFPGKFMNMGPRR